MKKLMIAAAIVATALASQAATANWNFSNKATIYDGTGKSTALGAGYAVYIFDAGVTSAESVFSQWEGGTTALTGSIASGSTTAAGKFEIRGVAYGEQSTSGNNYYDYFFAVVDSNKKIFVSKTKAGNKSGQNATAKDIALDDTDSNSLPKEVFAQGQWTAGAPEPTSAMLMLLGVAGLALKRKRA